MAACRRCTDSLLHCHGTLIRHDDGTVECSQPGCGGDATMHDFVVTCVEIQATCCAGTGLAGESRTRQAG